MSVASLILFSRDFWINSQATIIKRVLAVLVFFRACGPATSDSFGTTWPTVKMLLMDLM